MKGNKGLVLAIAVCVLSVWVGGQAHAATRYRWDIMTLPSFNPPTLHPGGFASAFANDGTRITLTGSGTFVLEERATVTGGGVWIIRGPLGNVLSLGTYQVTELLSFHEGPGRQPPTIVDNIANLADYRAGVALLRITFSDGSDGVLTVLCRIPGGPTPSGPLYSEGIAVSKGAIPFWHPEHDLPNVDGNRTAFHIMP